MFLEDISRFRGLFEASVKESPITAEDDATAILAAYSQVAPADRLFELIVTKENTGLNTATLRDLEKHFYLAHVVDSSNRAIAEALSNITACTPAVVHRWK